MVGRNGAGKSVRRQYITLLRESVGSRALLTLVCRRRFFESLQSKLASMPKHWIQWEVACDTLAQFRYLVVFVCLMLNKNRQRPVVRAVMMPVSSCSVLVSTDIKVFDSLLGIQDMQSETADSDRTASIYATARRYQKAAQNAADDRT